MISIQIASFCLCIAFNVLHSQKSSLIDFHGTGTDFRPANPRELLGIHSSVQSKVDCSFLCNQDPQCRTLVFDSSICYLYEGSGDTGHVFTATSSSSIVGELIYDDINLTSAYNQSCDHCYLDRYLVCKNDLCQCPPDTFWNGQDKCINQQYVEPALTCNSDEWCRQDMNLTCIYNKCQCPPRTFWGNQTCIPQFFQGTPCNTSDQCRNDLHMVCSRINKTCIGM
jgi:hypothetical protein